jgi:hypothetical protein
VHRLLIDTATAEYFFVLDFFEDESVCACQRLALNYILPIITYKILYG